MGGFVSQAELYFFVIVNFSWIQQEAQSADVVELRSMFVVVHTTLGLRELRSVECIAAF